MIGMLMILKTRWLFNIHFFIDKAIEKNTIHIHLKEFESTHTSKGQEQPHRFQSCNRSKVFTIVNALFLIVAFGN